MSTIPISWQRKAVERAARGADDAAYFHEKRSDDQAATARAYANSLEAAALTLRSMEVEGGLSARQDRPRRRA